MKKLAATEPVIVIEWAAPAGSQLSHDDIAVLARALGRLAAKRDLALVRRHEVSNRQSSDEKSAIVKVKARV